MVDYKIAIAIAMSSNHNAVLAALSSHLLGVHAKVSQLEGGFNRLKTAIGGALAISGGMAMFHVMEKLVDKTKDYSDELVKLKNLGGDMANAVVSGDISKRAFDISQRIPMKVTDLMKIPGATNSTLGTAESMEHWESFARTAWVLQGQKDYHGDVGTDLQALIKAGDLTGRIMDPKTGQIDGQKLDVFLDTATRAIAATHGLVSPQVLLGMAKQGGFTLRGLSDDGFLTQVMMAQMMGGPRSGTAYMSLWQQMAGGTMLSRTAQGMQDVGLLKSNEWKNDHGHVILDKGASQRLTKLIGTDPMDLAANLVEHFKKTGVTDPMEQMRLTMRALGRQTTQRYTAEEVTNFQQMLAERARIKQALGVQGSFGNFMGESVGANIEAMKNAWDNLLTAVAGPNSKNVISVLQSLTTGINSLQKVVTGMDPGTITSIGVGVASLAAALTGAGSVAILAAIGPAGWLIGGLAALAVALTDPRFRAWLKSDSISQAISAWFDKGWQALSGWLASHSIADMITSWLAPIWDKVKGLFGGKAEGEFGKELDKANKSYVPMRFDPGKQPMKATPISLSLNVDGRTLAQVISDKLDSLSGFETGAPAFNGGGKFI